MSFSVDHPRIVLDQKWGGFFDRTCRIEGRHKRASSASPCRRFLKRRQLIQRRSWRNPSLTWAGASHPEREMRTTKRGYLYFFNNHCSSYQLKRNQPQKPRQVFVGKTSITTWSSLILSFLKVGFTGGTAEALFDCISWMLHIIFCWFVRLSRIYFSRVV